ncbi:MAG: tetratricopeptide repeat protein [Deltaproteobacteria bacterium]|nr:tetratricopeptide repeat protein [Deltaproteobacteria bacterium]
MTMPHPPVLEVLPSVRRWERIRIPLAAAVIAVLLVAVAILVVRAIRQSQLEDDLAAARSALAEGTTASWARFDALLAEHEGLGSDERRVVALAALGTAMRSLLLGAPDPATARAAAARVAQEREEAATAAQAWAELLGDAPRTARLTDAARAFPASGPIRHAHALALARGGMIREALAEVGAARQAEPAYLAAAATQAELYRRAGQVDAARQSLLPLGAAQHPERGPVEAACILDAAEASGSAAPDVTALLTSAIATKAPRLVGRAKLAMGRQKLLSGDASAAVALLTEAVRLDPEDAESATQLARALLASGDAPGAVAAVDALGDGAPGAALLERALALTLLHRTRDAERTLGRIAQADLPAARGAGLRALLAWQKVDVGSAESAAAQAAAAGSTDALVLRAEILLEQGKRNPAVKSLAASRSGCARGFGLWIRGDWEEAASTLEAARADEGPCVSRVVGRTGLGLRPVAQLVTELERSLSRWPDAEDRILLGRLRARAGEDGAAEIARVMDAGAESLRALTLAAEAYAEMGKTAQAVAVVQKTKTLYPDDALPLATEIRVVRAGGDDGAAMRLSEAAVAAHPDQLDVVRERSITLVEAGRIAESERVSDVRFRPGRHFIEFARARIRAVEAAEGFRKADQQMVQALRFAMTFLPYSEEVRTRSLVALLHARRGGRRELDTAEAFLRPLVRRDTRSADFNLALAAIDRGYERVVQLGAHLRRALALDPMLPEAYEWLARADALEDEQRAQFERLYPGRPLRAD